MNRRFQSRIAVGSVLALATISVVSVRGIASAAAPTFSATQTSDIGLQSGGLPTCACAGLYGWGAATLQDGSVIIGDYWNNRVASFSAYTGSNGSSGSSTFNGDIIDNPGFCPSCNQAPYGLAVDPTDGNIIFADTNLPLMRVYSSTGTWLYNFGVGVATGKPFLPNGGLTYPEDAEVGWDPALNSGAGGYAIYVVDTWNHRVDIWQDNGNTPPTPITSFGILGTAAGDFKQPHGIAVDSQGNIWVADEGNYRVEEFTWHGATGTVPVFLTQIGNGKQGTVGKLGTLTGDLRGLAWEASNLLPPSEQALYPDGWIYVVDANSGFTDAYADTDSSTTPTYIGRVGGAAGNQPPATGTGVGQFEDGGRGVTIDGNGNVWVGDLGNFQVQVWAPTGLSTSGKNKGDEVFAPMAAYDGTGPATPPVGGFNGPRGVTVDSLGDTWVTDTYNERVEEFDPSGNFVQAFGLRGTGTGLFDYPRLLAYDPSDNSLIAADTDDNRIYKYSLNTTPPSFEWVLGGEGGGTGAFAFKDPYGVNVGWDPALNGGAGGEAIYVADSGNARVDVFPDSATTPNTGWATFGTKGKGSGAMNYPRGIAVDSDGSFWVSDQTNNTVEHWTLNGGGTYSCTSPCTFGSSGSATGKLVFAQPFAIALDANYVYIADSGNNRIQVMTRSGTYIGQIGTGTSGSGPTQLAKPQGLWLSNGLLYVAEQINDRVSVWTLTSP